MNQNIAQQFINSIFCTGGRKENEEEQYYTLKDRFVLKKKSRSRSHSRSRSRSASKDRKGRKSKNDDNNIKSSNNKYLIIKLIMLIIVKQFTIKMIIMI